MKKEIERREKQRENEVEVLVQQINGVMEKLMKRQGEQPEKMEKKTVGRKL
jgi:hypothetical protein